MSRPATTATLPERRLSVPAIRWTAVAPLLVGVPWLRILRPVA